MVERPYLVEALLHHVAKTRSNNVSRRNDCERNFRDRSAKSYRTSCGLSKWELPQWYFSWTRLVRVTAYVRRYIENSKRKRNSQPRRELPIDVSELREPAHFWFRFVQNAHFLKEWNALSNNEPIPKSSALKSLNPMLAGDSLLRLGRRLRNTALRYFEKHSIMLPRHRISEIFIDHAHRAILHGGTQLTLRTLREEYWIIGGRNLVKMHIRRCVICTCQSAKFLTQLMGNLPEPRVNPSPSFFRRWLRRAVQYHIVRRTRPESQKTLNIIIHMPSYLGDSLRNCGRLLGS